MSDEKDTGLREQARAMRKDLAPDRIEDKLAEVIEERPKAKYLLDFSIVGKAVLAAVVVAALLLLISPKLAAIALVVVFLGTWLILAQVGYDRRRETRDPDADPDAEPDESGYAADRGEVEAEQEQEGQAEDDDDESSSPDEPESRNGSAPEREPATG